MLGGVVSRTLMRCRQELEFPQASVAVQVRMITLVLPQRLLTESLELMVTGPQVSWAVATPFALVLVSAGHSNTTSLGHVIVGLVVSCTVMSWTLVVELPQASMAVHVRVITLVAPQLLDTESL